MFDPRPSVFDPDRHHRRSIRKRDHDYTSPGLYFVTFCTDQRHPWFGKVIDGKAMLNANGRIAHDHWHGIPGHYAHVAVRAFIIMPDHIHGIIELTDRPPAIGLKTDIGQRPLGPAPGSLGAIVGSYRAGVVREMNRIRPAPIRGLWQRGYHDMIIRDERVLAHFTAYILRHPAMVLPDT
jgi:putative transposase